MASAQQENIDITQWDILYFSSVIRELIDDTYKYDITWSLDTPVSFSLPNQPLSYWDALTVVQSWWEFRYSTTDGDWDISFSYNISRDDVPEEIIPEWMFIPDFHLSWEVEWVLSYVAERFDIVVPIYTYESSTTQLQIRWWLGISSYDFRLNGAISANWESQWEAINQLWYFSIRTKNPLLNPAVIWELDYSREFPHWNVLSFSFAWRYELGNAEAHVWLWYDYRVNRDVFITVFLWWEYRDYDSVLEEFSWFEDGWEEEANLWITWNLLSGVEINVDYDQNNNFDLWVRWWWEW